MSLLRPIIDWIRSLLAGKRSREVNILEQYHYEQYGLSAFRYHDSSVPGLVEFWKIERHQERTEFFLCVVSIALLKEQLQSRSKWQEENLNTAAPINQVISTQVRRQNNILASHYWITGFRIEGNGIDSKGRSYRTHRYRDVQCVACDLQGGMGYFAGDRWAKVFARKVISQIASGNFREVGYHRTWRAAVKSIDWSKWLENLAYKYIDPTHVLQPQKKISEIKKDRRRDEDRRSR